MIEEQGLAYTKVKVFDFTWRSYPYTSSETQRTFDMGKLIHSNALATAGRYYGFENDTEAMKVWKVSQIQDHAGQNVNASSEKDSSWIKIDTSSGIVLESHYRYQLCYTFDKSDPVFDHFKDNYVMPFVYE